MDFALTDTQAALKAVARRVLSERYRPNRGSQSEVAAADAELWSQVGALGWLDADLGPVELAVLAEECGYALGPASWCTTAGSALPLYRAAGETPPGPAALVDGASSCEAVRDGAGWLIAGEVTDVVDAWPGAELVVAARAAGDLTLFVVGAGAAGVARDDFDTVDPSRACSDLTFTAAPARLLVDGPDVRALLTSVAYQASVVLASEGIGVAERALAIAVGYARTREQFGRPIGSYQAVSHQLADCYADIELARSLAYRAAAVLADGQPHPGEATACAVHAARQAALRAGAVATQVCGGIGVTWEFELHWWCRRAWWLDAYHATQPDPLIALESVLLD